MFFIYGRNFIYRLIFIYGLIFMNVFWLLTLLM